MNINFLKELTDNNNRVWFDANKKRYEATLRQPFEALIARVIADLSQKESGFANLQAKDCVYRIYRDVRFSADKTPYKTNISALIAPDGRKQATCHGLYVELSFGRLFLAGGMYQPTPAQVNAVRTHILNHSKQFDTLLTNAAFAECYGTIQGEENKRLNAEFMEAAKKQPILLKKQYLYMAELPAATLLQDDAVAILLKYYHATVAMSSFLEAAQQ
jgi:uncharacterized protein (TIGR02453 family)